MPYLPFIGAAVAAIDCWLLDTFTDADSTVIDVHTPEEAVGDFAWYGTKTITSNRIYSPASASTIQGYKSAYDAFGVTAPFKITMVGLISSPGYCGVLFENFDNTTRIIVEFGGLGNLTVVVLDPVTEAQDIANGVAIDVEHTIEILFEAQRFQTIINGVPRPAVDFVGDIPVDMVTAILRIDSSDSYISSIAVCATEEEIVDVQGSSMLLKFDSGLLVDQNSTRTNTLTANGSPTAVTTDKKWGTHSAHFDTTSNENIDVVSPSDFRSAGQEATLDFWFNPTTAGTGDGFVLHNTLMAMATGAPVTQTPSGGNLIDYIWWSTSSGGTFGYRNSGRQVTGITAGVWHHCRICWYADDEASFFCDGNRIGARVAIGADSFDVISIGNQRTASQALDGLAGNYVWQGFIDSVRMITGTALEPATATTMTVPAADFPNV